MDPERTDIRRFLAAHPPFDGLPGTILDALTQQVGTMDVAEATVVLRPKQYVRCLYLVRSGRIEIRGPASEIWAHRKEGETFGVGALLGDGHSSFHAVALEDSSLILLPETAFARLRLEHGAFDRFFSPLGGNDWHLAHAGLRLTTEEQPNLIALRVGDLMTANPLTIDGERSVREAAALMHDRRISCLPVTAAGEFAGMLTTVDLRDRVIAAGLPAETRVAAVMTPQPFTLAAESLAYDAVLAMRERTLSHLPVMQDGRLVGVVTDTDVLRRQGGALVDLSGEILRRQTPASMAEVVAQIPQLLVALVETGVSARKIGLTITAIADVTTYRLLQLAEEQLGSAPVPYVWLSSGSQARQEQTGVSDQDNCLIIDDRFDEAMHGAYFDQLSRFVCDGLHACGYVYCPGEMMAMTPKWRQPLSQWKRYFRSWINEPEPTAQMLASVQFDLRPVRGETRLFDDLQAFAFEKAQANSLFVAFMAGNALTHTPPLGFFLNTVLSRRGERSDAVDLKMHGAAPIVDIGRVHALRAGARSANTHDRLMAAHEAGVISETGRNDLIDAFAFLSLVRLKHQAQQIKRGEKPDNHVSPKELTRIERHHLREAFLIVQTMQTSLTNTFQIQR